MRLEAEADRRRLPHAPRRPAGFPGRTEEPAVHAGSGEAPRLLSGKSGLVHGCPVFHHGDAALHRARSRVREARLQEVPERRPERGCGHSLVPVRVLPDGGFTECEPILVSGAFWGWNLYGNIHGPFTSMSVAPNTYSTSAKWGTPYSFHPGGLQVAYGDGSVRWIAETIGFNVWTALAKKADGSTLKY